MIKEVYEAYQSGQDLKNVIKEGSFYDEIEESPSDLFVNCLMEAIPVEVFVPLMTKEECEKIISQNFNTLLDFAKGSPPIFSRVCKFLKEARCHHELKNVFSQEVINKNVFEFYEARFNSGDVKDFLEELNLLSSNPRPNGFGMIEDVLSRRLEEGAMFHGSWVVGIVVGNEVFSSPLLKAIEKFDIKREFERAHAADEIVFSDNLLAVLVNQWKSKPLIRLAEIVGECTTHPIGWRLFKRMRSQSWDGGDEQIKDFLITVKDLSLFKDLKDFTRELSSDSLDQLFLEKLEINKGIPVLTENSTINKDLSIKDLFCLEALFDEFQKENKFSSWGDGATRLSELSGGLHIMRLMREVEGAPTVKIEDDFITSKACRTMIDTLSRRGDWINYKGKAQEFDAFVPWLEKKFLYASLGISSREPTRKKALTI